MVRVLCNKKICEYNSACCSHDKSKEFYCKKESIKINDEVECEHFTAIYDKIEICNKCSLKEHKCIKLKPPVQKLNINLSERK